MDKLNAEQQRLLADYGYLVDEMACRLMSSDVDYDCFYAEARKAMAKAVTNYVASRHGKFENYARGIIKTALDRYTNSEGNVLFSVNGAGVSANEEYYNSGREVLRDEFNHMLRQQGFYYFD